ncbi:class I SAM-dependent methyltransferase [Streptomyces vietnamensis]|uniref:SAM-dependent methyltransferase n=1 Tax=Streptomyces vietnamensis TaxID=362257 RepID=A0A0B5IBZ1_9ACTN|nr:class I SAM-dependent methyltransferase [Streptomyces vietnamensis]AJF67173.1 SAM-dependent methyltransferase [Streptomyces vietnamensis]
MAALTDRVLRALERFNAAHPWDHNAHYHRWILRQLPRRLDRALDVGCGSGDLARLLATRATAVRAVDADPAIVARARELTAPGTRVTFAVEDALADTGDDGSHTAVTCLATLHHLPLAPALARFRDRLAPGGTLVVLGLARPDTAGDHLLGLLSIPLNAATGWLRNRGRPAPRPVAMTAATRDAEETLAEIALVAGRILPGARIRRRLFWRYTLVWRKPDPGS